ncbi:hypothetical protein BSIN_1696 [Burkholderia singularis]|uniref:Uncharacterized protein n=1 Tax=Burkholderia singularis TaxID=1503053 RepID=A0A238GZN3_9BURK|nr:hypothetical protein BSIN_1696 [Burkholderia singularis]
MRAHRFIFSDDARARLGLRAVMRAAGNQAHDPSACRRPITLP